jgi:hypothetical protein
MRFSWPDPSRASSILSSGIKCIGARKISMQKYRACIILKFSIIVRHPASISRGAYRERHDTRGGDAVDAKR